MDKLQPIIKQRYWICFGLAIIFVMAGWWMASGAIATETATRKDIVEKAFSAASQGATDPNEKWVEEAKKKNKSDETAYNSASQELWKRQQNARRWPSVIAADLKGVPYLDQIKSSETRGKWASIYKDQIEQLLAIVQPYKDGEGLVIVDIDSITHKPFNSWRYGLPSSLEIWNSQEDIWLLQSILTSIARVNEGATQLTESQVRVIHKLTLRGGDRNAKPASAGGGGMGGKMGGAMMMGGGMGGMAMSAPGGLGGGIGGDPSASYPGKDFEGSTEGDILAEEFGADAASGGLGGLGGGGGEAASAGMKMSMAGGGMMGGGAAKKAEEKRFVDEQQGYKTRAFLLDVVVRDDQLPNLLASLTNSDFPVEIVRVDISSASSGTTSGGMSGGMGGPEMGGPGMSGPGMSGPGMSGPGMSGPEMGGLGMSGPGMGGSGMGRPGMSAAPEMAGGPGIGMPAGGGLGRGTMGGMSMGMSDPSGVAGGMGALGSGKGAEIIQAAMIDPLLVNVRIGGLMTLYQSAQETDTQAKTELAEPVVEPAVVPPAEGASEEASPETPASGPDAAAPATEAGAPGAAGDDSGAPAVPPGEPASSPDAPASTPPGSDGNTAAPAENGTAAEPAPDPDSAESAPGVPGTSPTP